MPDVIFVLVPIVYLLGVIVAAQFWDLNKDPLAIVWPLVLVGILVIWIADFFLMPPLHTEEEKEEANANNEASRQGSRMK